MLSNQTFRIAWRNLGRNRKRTLLALTAIAVGQFGFLATSSLMNGYGEVYLNSVTGPMVGHIQVHAPGWREDRSLDLTLENLETTLWAVREDPEVKYASPRIYAPAMIATEGEGFMGVVIGVDPIVESHPSGLLAGQDFSRQVGDHRVLVGRSFARKNSIEPGMEIAVIGQDVDGSIANDLFVVTDLISTSVDIVNSLGIVMKLEETQELFMMPEQAHEIVIHVADTDVIPSTVARLSALPALADEEVLPWREIVPELVSLIDLMTGFRFFILLIVFIAAMAGIANTMLMSTFERRHEFGMLLSLGCGPNRLSGMIAFESAVLGLLGVAVGTAFALALVILTSKSGIDYAAMGGRDASFEMAFKGIYASSRVIPRMYPSDVAFGVIAVLLTSIVSVVWPMVHIARLHPVEAMRP
ncbi:MAG: ABC transporter permease [Candidatus Eiseniibacteriota bacterium]|nr:MAG: ABC transporter permease [Candidatus Eisenbacteria bacterium]